MGTKVHEILRSIMLRALMAVDMGLLMVSVGAAIVLSTHADTWTSFESFFATRVSLSSVALFAIALFLAHGLLKACNLYESRRMSTKAAEALDVLRATTLLTMCLWGEGKLFHISHMTTYFLIAFWVIGTVLIVVTRILLRYVLGRIRKHGRNLHYVLIIGTNSRAIHFGRMIEAKPERGFHLLGFVDDVWSGTEEFKESGFKLCCEYGELAEFLRRNVVDEIVIYLPLRSLYQRAADIAQLARQHGILVRLDQDVLDLKFTRYRTEAEQVVASSSSVDGWQLLLKRIFDFAVSLVLLVVFSPLFLIVTILIKLSSPGPVIFAQKRVGLNKRQFTMYKFRTMVPTAENIQAKLAHLNEMTGPVFKIKDDPRITPIGRILRKTSIDELPQLFNVLKGDMSLVGPRAMSVRDYQFFSEDWQRRRFSVPPGITCLWQVYGRNTIPFEQWMILDMQYIDKWSLWLDLKILALTIPAVFKGS